MNLRFCYVTHKQMLWTNRCRKIQQACKVFGTGFGPQGSLLKLISMKHLLIVAAILMSGFFAFANALPIEQDLSALMLDQKDSLFYDLGVIRAGDDSSLCGPTSAVNWLQLKVANQAYPKKDLVRLVKEISTKNYPSYQGINNGMTEHELVKFMNFMNSRLNVNIDYQIKGRSVLSEGDLFSDQVQILLVKYAEIPRAPERPPGGIGGRRPPPMYNLPHEEPLIRGFHFVLKVAADANTREITVIDPENPTRYTRVYVIGSTDTGIKIKPTSKSDFPHFSFGVPLTWSVVSAIEEKAN